MADALNNYQGPDGQTPPIVPFVGVGSGTPVIPKLYWDAYDDEQRIKLLWKCFGQIADLVNQLSYYYIPSFAGDWDATVQYPPLTVVSAPAGIEGVTEGDSYTALKYVPVGTPLTDTEYWAKTGNYNAQVAELQQMVEGFDAKIAANATAAQNAQTAADNAQTAADNAQTAADNAQTAADSKAPIAHASSESTYGVGSSQLYGHVKLSDEASSSDASNGVAATPLALINLENELNNTIDKRRTPYGAKSIMFGDSNTLATYTSKTILEYINDLYGMTGYNYGVSSATFSNVSGYPQIVSQINERSADNTIDYCFIFGGINDYHYGDGNAATFKEAVASTVSAAHTKYQNAMIVLIFDGGKQMPNGLMFDFMRAMTQPFNFPVLVVPTADLCLDYSLWYNQNHYNDEGMLKIRQRVAQTLEGSVYAPVEPKVNSSTPYTGMTVVEVISIDPVNLILRNEADVLVSTSFQSSISGGTAIYTFIGTMTANTEFDLIHMVQTPSSFHVIPIGLTNGSNNSGQLADTGPTVKLSPAYDISPSGYGVGRASWRHQFVVV